MRLPRALSFVLAFSFPITLAFSFVFFQGVSFAEESYIDGDAIVINGIRYENRESSFSKIKTSTVEGASDTYDTYEEYDTYNELSTVGLDDYFVDDVEENKYSNADGKTVIPEIGSTDGKAITPKILCTTPSSEDCVNVWYLTTPAIGEPVSGSFYEQTSLWQKLYYDGNVYYTPVDGLGYGGGVVEKNEDGDVNYDALDGKRVNFGNVNSVSKMMQSDKNYQINSNTRAIQNINNPPWQEVKENQVKNTKKESSFWDYMKRSGEQVILGNFTEEVTLAGTAGQVGLGILGVDLPMDIRDLSHDFAHWEWSWGHAGKTILDGIGLVPVVGVLKNVDEVSTLVKRVDYKSVKKITQTISNKTVRLTRKLADNTSATIRKIGDKLKFWGGGAKNVKIGDEMVTVYHRTTPENLKSIQESGVLIGKKPEFIWQELADFTEGKNPLVWVGEGKQNPLKNFFSGMSTKTKGATIEFSVPKSDVIQTPWLKSIFGNAQKNLKLSNEVVNGKTVQGFKLPDNTVYTVEKNIPKKAENTLYYVLKNDYKSPDSQVGGKIFNNREGALPKGGNYKEYDVDVKLRNQPRNAERIVVDKNNNNAWYTDDHYKTFDRIKMREKKWYQFWK